MAPQRWDPYRILTLTSSDSTSMLCVRWSNLFVTGCQFRISNENLHKARAVLDILETRPSEEALKRLTELTKLCLCEYHGSNQANNVEEYWASLVENATKGDRVVEALKALNRLLKATFEKELGEGKRLEGMWKVAEEGQECKEVEEVSFQLGAAQDTASVRKKAYNNARAARKKHLQEVQRLQFEVANARQISTQRQKAQMATSKKTEALKIQVDELQSQLGIQHQTSNSLRGELDKKREVEDDLLAQIGYMQTELSTERQNSKRVKDTLCEVEKLQVVLQQVIKGLQSDSAVPYARIKGLYREYIRLKGQEEALHTQLCYNQRVLSATQAELEESCKALNEQKVVATNREKALLAQELDTQTVLDSTKLELKNTATALKDQKSIMATTQEALLARISDGRSALETTQLELKHSHKAQEVQQCASTSRETDLLAQISGIQAALNNARLELDEVRRTNNEQNALQERGRWRFWKKGRD
ncbi:uncharacterized protein BP5553_02192 [Venustampulla echinocandica]|uniref:Uncharacterized protein n=1 Tax=Venustampulla echinocandica TaxID=2656787 RepID=A0A370U3A4_9HELO|nr:uncharacterized protein BP5553_02192 [Venustampulla echinocandica]RDL42213.1 hypothetical protein BP5553_02192 [Venustampulla echinocandica]